MRSKWTAITLGLLVGVPAYAVVFEGGPDLVIFPRQSIPLRFDHARHVRKPDAKKGLEGEDLSCGFCHERVAEQARSEERDIPGHAVCEGCHDDAIGTEARPAPREACATCHADLAAGQKEAGRVEIPPPNLKFSHKIHVDAKVECTGCHADVPEKALATREDYPTMDRCVGCHEGRGVPTTCVTCHLALPSGRLVTDFAEGPLMPRRAFGAAVHAGDFLRDHGRPAARDRALCGNCHGESACLECHDGAGRDARYHGGDFLVSHGARAKKDDLRCESCHRLQSFCLDCHVRSGVATAFDRATLQPTRTTIRVGADGLANGPHPMSPDGWTTPGSRNFHGFFAQRNVRACVSCHEEQSCLECHRSAFGTGLPSTIGGNPHGPNPGRLRGSPAAKQNARMCLKCHSPLDPNWR